MTLPGNDASLLEFSLTLTLNEFENVWLHQDPDTPFLQCYSKVKHDYENISDGLKADEVLDEKNVYFERSPCHNLKNDEPCQNYCRWFWNMTSKVKKEDILTLVR